MRDLWRRARGLADTLAGRLLAIITVSVLTIEALVFVPALANFHETWVRERINLSQVAALALEAAQESEIGEQLEYELLTNAEVQRVVLLRDGERQLLLVGPTPIPPGRLVTYDYTRARGVVPAFWSLETFFAPEGRILRVLARPRYESGELIEIVLNEAPLKRATHAFAGDFVLASMLILIAAAAISYVVLSFFIVRPMRELTRAIIRFRDKPEDVSVAFVRSRRGDEIGRAQDAAADMAEQVRAALRQRERLASLGAAVARIGHDLRNMLGTAQMVADRLAKSEDPAVRQVAPRLERAIDRAAGLATSTLKYGRADERAPVLEQLNLAAIAQEAADDALLGFDEIRYRADIEPGLSVQADSEHLHRIFVNLMRNAAQAMRDHPRVDRIVSVRALVVDGRCDVEIIDRGPGVAEKYLDKLFDPFVSAAPESGGTGLGLAISRELARAMGGELALTRTGAEGATFLLTLKA
ncbi:sensor histidine kinase [alpha proteobacterium U9-1i]|nr:sensor histidine kinase [alpha proteobacterium U9-1i]